MENNEIVKSIEKEFDTIFEVFDEIIDICPNELWNKKCSGFTFWHQLVHAFSGTFFWLREEKPSFDEGINGKNVVTELDAEYFDKEMILKEYYSKEIVKEICNETKELYKKWFYNKNDEWLKKPHYNKTTNFETTLGQIRHLMYHIGHCEAIYRENNIKTGEYK
ncbi:hypothetical protein AGMMS49587_20490 [Spirochaetia bacterium]|nr:hypothetical protein AGMMS49587_20490 [Spirochaetia bacterium]